MPLCFSSSPEKPWAVAHIANLRAVAAAVERSHHSRRRHYQQKCEAKDYDDYPDAATTSDDLPQATPNASDPEDYDNPKESQY